MTTGPIDGELFRLNYLRSPIKLPDSQRARLRVYQLCKEVLPSDEREKFGDDVLRRLGVEVPYGGYGSDYRKFWLQIPVGDFLSALTLLERAYRAMFGTLHNPPSLLTQIREIIAEEDLHYRVDELGGVHFLVDEEFTYLAESTIAALSSPRLTAARVALESGLRCLGVTARSGKGLIRGVFEAVESASLVAAGAPNANRLNKQLIDNHIKPLLLKRYGGFPDATDKVTRMTAAFDAWVHEAHPYRHGAPFDQVHEAPLELALVSGTTGMGYLRLMAALVENPTGTGAL